MSCHHPLTAFRNRDGGSLIFDYADAASGEEIKVPCRRCLGCRIDHEVEWSIRMMHEASQHEHNQFITLTYDNKNLPLDNSLDHTHVQKFIRALRQKTKQKLRYFAAGEYGEEQSRPHYHLIIFGLELKDLKRYGGLGSKKTYTSERISEAWLNRGFVLVGAEVTRATCVYVAGYLLKDFTKEWKNQFEWTHYITGETVQRKKPYCKMSNRPGIGKDWYEKYSSDVFPDDFVIMDGKKFKTPAYYRRQLEKENPQLFEDLYFKGQDAMTSEKYQQNNTPERLAVREKCLTAKAGDKSARGLGQKGSIGSGKHKNKNPMSAARLTEKFRQENHG